MGMMDGGGNILFRQWRPRIGKPGFSGTPIGIEDEDRTGKNGFGGVSERPGMAEETTSVEHKNPQDEDIDLVRACDGLSLSESVSTRKRKLEDEADEESEDEGEVDVKATKNDKAQVQTQKWDKRLGRQLGFKITRTEEKHLDVLRKFLLGRVMHNATRSFFGWLHHHNFIIQYLFQ